MRVNVNAPGYKDLAIWRIKRLADGVNDREETEEIADAAVGMDVQYVLRSNNIELVKRYLKSPVGIEEYRRLRGKLLELQAQIPALPVQEMSTEEKLTRREDSRLAPESREKQPENLYYQKDSLVDLVA